MSFFQDSSKYQPAEGGIYLHIPFCKQACTYCNFHFVTSTQHKPAFVLALLLEIEHRAASWSNKRIRTVYFGGGTPSMLTLNEFTQIWEALVTYFDLSAVEEITLEANPDDLTAAQLADWKNYTAINRLSIGIQSFFESDLLFMGRAHNAKQADQCIDMALTAGFQNLTADLIYGLPNSNADKWQSNMERLFTHYQLPHVSCYALTLESGTPLAKKMKSATPPATWDDLAADQLFQLHQFALANGYEHYEISNLALPGAYSKHNSAYWMGQPYLGLGPSAHSFDGKNTRSWNVANNAQYIRQLNTGQLPSEQEHLTTDQHYNESLLTRLRTTWGLHPDWLSEKFGASYKDHFEQQLAQFTNPEFLELSPTGSYRLTFAGQLMADGVALHFFK